ncbi:hypothetical protein [Halopseudomonas maritima]|uniref:hypothetical protein n=1 Tax=Halopseudomonas maritima TaxID=2918528 RepID=UPI001EEC4250|nr:hypothetical protein [Halopseudomonas maritima]UJJ32003.1 hypothetical protein HV822_02205 [Halopseudomonas maritima]
MTDQPDSTPDAPASRSLGALFSAAANTTKQGAAPQPGKGVDRHAKRVHMPPRGTRRSMGKR